MYGNFCIVNCVVKIMMNDIRNIHELATGLVQGCQQIKHPCKNVFWIITSNYQPTTLQYLLDVEK